MPFREGSPEARIAEICECAVKRRVIAEGGLVLQTSLAGIGAALFEGPQGAFRALDLLTGVWRGAYFWEIKAKGGPDDLRKLNVLRHGIDRCCWDDYWVIADRFKLAGGLAIVQLCETRGAFDRARQTGIFPKPRLLTATLAKLKERLNVGDMHYGPITEKFPTGAVFWDVADFDDCGELEISDLGSLPQQVQLKLHPWERADRLGILPDVPKAQQRTLFDD